MAARIITKQRSMEHWKIKTKGWWRVEHDSTNRGKKNLGGHHSSLKINEIRMAFLSLKYVCLVITESKGGGSK